MWTEDYRWHFDYVRLAWDSGFTFEKYKYPNLDKNKICLVDVDRVIRERDVASIEKFIPTVVQYILESDQAEVLDTNFVKLFRMSQLSVEYLLFCKKYLDNTVVLLKKEISKVKEENKKLKLFAQDLEDHISTLAKQNNLITTFKCEKCTKVFSSEEYLSSHIKRRHNEENNICTNTETDILQSEIKELKQRLNVTEKLLQEKDNFEKSKSDINVDENKMRVEEIQDKFEKFKEKVENDLTILQMQKNFYEEKYSKLFDIVLQLNNKEDVSSNICQKVTSEQEEINKEFLQNVKEKIENTTQTDKEANNSEELLVEAIQNKNVYSFKKRQDSSEDLLEKKENIEDTIEQKINKFEENIESKISSGLNNIQSQMEAFWGRLSELELKREKVLIEQQNRHNVFEQVIESAIKLEKTSIEPSKLTTEALKPEIKPRTKLSKPNLIRKGNEDNAEKIKKELEKLYSRTEIKSAPVSKHSLERKSSVKVTEPSSSAMYNTSITSESELESKLESGIVEIMPKKSYGSKPSNSTIDKQSIMSVKSSVKSKVSVEKVRREIMDILNDRLQEMGISSNWQGIPLKTFEKALAIVEHQASLTKKMYPDYDSIKKSIERSLKNKDLNRGNKVKSKSNISPKKQQPSVINICYRRKSKETELEAEPQTQTVTIKNRSLYEDSESDSVQPNKPPVETSHPLPLYSDVIEEHKTAHKENGDTDSDLNSIILPNDDKVEKNSLQTKSVLKNYPSMGSLTKKKVLFDIDTDESKVEVPQMEINTTNVTDSVSNGQQKRENKDKKEDSMSDFDLSEY